MTLIKYNRGFKIRTKSDAREFLEKCISGEGYIVIKINPTEAYYIYSSKDGFSHITLRYGDLSNIFNPEIRIVDEKNIDIIWKIRKYINQKWFN